MCSFEFVALLRARVQTMLTDYWAKKAIKVLESTSRVCVATCSMCVCMLIHEVMGAIRALETTSRACVAMQHVCVHART